MMNDKTKLVKEAKKKNDKASRCRWSAYQKKRLGEMGLGEMRLPVKRNENRRNATQPFHTGT